MTDDYNLAGGNYGRVANQGGPNQPTIIINNIPPKKPWLGRMFTRTILFLSIVANLILLGMIGQYFSGIVANEKYHSGSKTAKDKIALIHVNDAIMGDAVKNPIKDIEAARDDKDVKAVILRFNSPGGDVMATDNLYRAILDYKTKTEGKKPLIVLMDGIAASGAFWAAMPGDKIIAGENTITGSIGVVMQTFVLTGLMKEWGVEPITFKTGERKDVGSMFREMNDTDREEINKLMNAWYDQFLNVVLKHRGEKIGGLEKLKPIADGRVFLGNEAKDLGLIDDIGYMEDAIKAAKELAGLSGETRVVEYLHQPSLSELLSVKNETPAILSRDALTKFQTPRILAMPASMLGGFPASSKKE